LSTRTEKIAVDLTRLTIIETHLKAIVAFVAGLWAAALGAGEEPTCLRACARPDGRANAWYAVAIVTLHPAALAPR